MITQSQKMEKSCPQWYVDTKDVISTNGLLLTDGQDKSMDIALEKDSSFLVIIVDGFYFFEPL